MKKMNDIIYLDNAATTKVDPRVVEVMLPYFTEHYGNAASKHIVGSNANRGVESARESISDLIGCANREIIFTSGATESINLALKGFVESNKENGNHIITVKTEHNAVLDSCEYLATMGYEVTYLGVDKNGLINLEELKQSIKEETILASVMFANNETGVIQPIKEISEICHERNVYFMSDATQAVGKIKIDVEKFGIDIMSFSGHKFHGPKGVGGLYIRRKRPFKVKLEPLLHGGGHEKGFRSGTLNVPGIVGLGKACELAKAEMNDYNSKVRKLRDDLEKRLLDIKGVWVNGDLNNRLPNILNIGIEGVDSDALLSGLEDIAISKGSACSSASVNPSHVLKAMGLSERESYESIRISFSKNNNIKECDYLLSRLKMVINNLVTMSI